MIFIPQTRFFKFKSFLLSWCGAKIGSNVRIVSSARFNLTGCLVIGSGTWIGHDVLIVGGDADIEIGQACDIAPRVTLTTGTHEINKTGLKVAGDGYSLPIIFGDGCWVCTGATVLGGTVLGDRCIVAAGAVIKNTFESGSIIGGVPGHLLGCVNEYDEGKLN